MSAITRARGGINGNRARRHDSARGCLFSFIYLNRVSGPANCWIMCTTAVTAVGPDERARAKVVSTYGYCFRPFAARCGTDRPTD